MKNAFAFFFVLLALSGKAQFVSGPAKTPAPKYTLNEKLINANSMLNLGRGLEAGGGLMMILSPFLISRPSADELKLNPYKKSDYSAFNLSMAVGGGMALAGLIDEVIVLKRIRHLNSAPQRQIGPDGSPAVLRLEVQPVRIGLGFCF
jgi:hypothetical protein